MVYNSIRYGTSLFKRFQEAGFPVQMLKIQYRMHPEVSFFLSLLKKAIHPKYAPW